MPCRYFCILPTQTHYLHEVSPLLIRMVLKANDNYKVKNVPDNENKNIPVILLRNAWNIKI